MRHSDKILTLGTISKTPSRSLTSAVILNEAKNLDLLIGIQREIPSAAPQDDTAVQPSKARKVIDARNL